MIFPGQKGSSDNDAAMLDYHATGWLSDDDQKQIKL